MLTPSLLHALVPESSRKAALSRNKVITLLHDGGFDGDAWGWQFTDCASIDRTVGHSEGGSLRIRTSTGDYARFLILNPRAGARYTVAGWVKTEGVKPVIEGGGAFFAAPQFEFQGRPAEYTPEGFIEERHFGNIVGDSGWVRFQQTFTCRSGTTWFEVTLGIYRASGTAWFDDVTFVEEDRPAELSDVVEPAVAASWAHAGILAETGKRKPAAAILRDSLPIRGAASDPVRLASLLGRSYETRFLTARELADASRFNRNSYDLLVLPYGEAFPLEAESSVRAFLAAGGDLFTTGGYAFLSPLVRTGDSWAFDDENVWCETGENLIPSGRFSSSLEELQSAGWKRSSVSECHLDSAGHAATVAIPAGSPAHSADWRINVKAHGSAARYYFEAKLHAEAIEAEQDGSGAFISVEQLDASGTIVYATPADVVLLKKPQGWQTVREIIALSPITESLRVRFGLNRACGTLSVAGIRLEPRSKEPRINTAKGFPQDSLVIEPEQIGMFDPDYRLKRVAWLEPAFGQAVLQKPLRVEGPFGGYAACGVLGINNARWIPLLNAHDRYGRLRGAAGALMHHYGGYFARSSWAYFGVDTADLFASGLLDEFVQALAGTLVRKCYLHELETDVTCYQDGEPARIRTQVSNFGSRPQTLRVEFEITSPGESGTVFRSARTITIAAGETAVVTAEWRPARFTASRYEVAARLLTGAEVIDEAKTGFLIWKNEALLSGGKVGFRGNYMQLSGHSTFLQGTDDYVYMFLNRSESPLSWQADASGCRDACVDIYENLLGGLRGPQQNPPRQWWRWVDGMLLSVQHAGGVFMPGMLIFSNTAVGDTDLAEQQQFCRKFAERYRGATGLIYYLNGDLELHDPNVPDLQRLYHEYLRAKYGFEEELKRAWTLSPPEAPLEKLRIQSGKDNWRDLRSLDSTQFRTGLVIRWLNGLSRAIREVDTSHPITAEFYQSPGGGIDLISGSGELTFSNFGYFGPCEADRRRFPGVLKILDQRLKGKGAHVGEFGVKTHPGWSQSTSYLQTRSEEYEQQYFLEITHTAFGQGGTKVQNWSWKYPADLPFEWGINYPCDSVPRDVRAYYRNSGLLFRYFRPQYEVPEVVFLLPDQARQGGHGYAIHEALLNGIRLLIDLRVPFAVLDDGALDKLPDGVKVIFYPVSYCPADETVERLAEFVRRGGRLYLSGDVSYDARRQRTKTARLEQLCGVAFERELYPDIGYSRMTPVEAANGSNWPSYRGAPGIVVRPLQASVLAAASDGTPVVLENKIGAGRVLFTSDPFELHAPTNNPDGLRFYNALVKHIGVPSERVEPDTAPLHAYRVPAENGEAVHVVVNYGDEELKDIRLFTAAEPFSFTLPPHRPGVGALNGAGQPIAVESAGEARYGNQLLFASTAHTMMIAADRRGLVESATLLLLPMGVGKIRIPNAKRWRDPFVVVGAVERGRWKTYETFRPAAREDNLEINIDQDRNLSMLWLAESGSSKDLAALSEAWVLRPWELK